MFYRLRQKFSSFMYGRYGLDGLYNFLLVLYLLLAVLNVFLHSIAVWALSILLIVYMFFRVFSRNIYKRRRENEKFMGIWRAVKSWLKYTGDRIRDIPRARYRKCTKCKAILRLPIKRGTNKVKCPRCGETFEVFVLL